MPTPRSLYPKESRSPKSTATPASWRCLGAHAHSPNHFSPELSRRSTASCTAGNWTTNSRSLFWVLASRFVFKFGSEFGVQLLRAATLNEQVFTLLGSRVPRDFRRDLRWAVPR